MSQMMLQRHRPGPARSAGVVVPFECAVCGRGPGDGTAITSVAGPGARLMLCDSHIGARGA